VRQMSPILLGGNQYSLLGTLIGKLIISGRICRLPPLKEFEIENNRLRCAVSDLTLNKLIRAEAEKGNFQAPPATGPCVDQITAELGICERRACRALGQHRSMQPTTPMMKLR
jgi:hypothetical protein